MTPFETPRYLSAGAAGAGPLLTLKIKCEKLPNAESEWLKRQCDLRWTTAGLPPPSAQAAAAAARPHEAQGPQGEAQMHDSSMQTRGYPFTLAPHHQIVAALQVHTLLRGEAPWLLGMRTLPLERRDRRVSIYGSLSLHPNLLRALTSFRIGTAPLERNVDHDMQAYL